MNSRSWSLIAFFLCVFGLSVSQSGGDDLSALVQAVSVNDTNTMQSLISKGANVNQRFGKMGETVLFRAALWGRRDAASLLMKAGADLSVTNKWGNTPFQIAASRGHKAVAELLLKKEMDFDAPDALGRTALLMAAAEGSEEAALWLLRMGADPNVQANNSGETVMFYAAFNGNAKLVKALIDKRVRPDCKGREGWSPLHASVMRGDTNIVTLLISGGCAVDPIDERGFTPLLLGLHQGLGDQPAIIDVLVSAGANVEKRDKNGNSVLDLARQRLQKAENDERGSRETRAENVNTAKALLDKISHYYEQRQGVGKKQPTTPLGQ